MNCFECATQLQRVTPAVVTCTQCGASACVEHTAVGSATVADHSPGNPTRHRLPGRRMFCTTCAPPEAVTLGADVVGDVATAGGPPGL